MDSHPTIPDDILAVAEDLIPQMDVEPGKSMRGSMVYYAAMAIKQERQKYAAIERDATRYRWLRDGNAYRPEEMSVEGGDDLDALCDDGLAGGVGDPDASRYNVTP